uniref:ETFB lysine methyltransferase n=1 Tax=Skeletonema marinoi TaxID=267567 RepID=A0A7S2M2C6_9STRA|mmetsp:Transcript_33042/g.56021  ORF Transcript_33042/g.56021 Transcript_33042/m.56021 type:complete len:325 (+) Transcript_33042:89-1063(+)
MLSTLLLAICSLSIGEEHLFAHSFATDTSTTYVHHHADTIRRSRTRVIVHQSKQSDLTDWVIENLEDNGSITSSDAVKAGEGDTLPKDGLVIGRCRVFAALQRDQSNDDDDDDEFYPIYLYLGRNGWGTGVHPTTRLCLEWLGDHGIKDGDILLDYGCGSGILSIAALHFGASRCIGVDVEAEALVTAERNIELNGWDGRFQGMHTREVLPYDVCPPRGASLCVANILIGQLVRPSMVAALTTNLEDGGLLCLSGIRPGEVDALKAAYTGFEWLDDQYAELSATETTNSIESYGFDCGRWARIVGRKKVEKESFIQQMSDLAVS